MKRVFILFVSVVFIAAMAACQPAVVPAGAGDTPDTVVPAGAVDTNPQEPAVAYVTLDVNPSIELTLTGGLVTEVAAFNDDGAAVILGTNVTGLTAEEAVAAIISQLSTDGYLSAVTEASLVITVTGDAEEGLTKSLKETAEKNIETLGADCDIIAASVPAEAAEAAKGLGISAGRYMMLSYIAQQEGITIEEAITRYGSLPMEKVFEFVEETEEFLSEVGDWNELIAGLPADQQAIIYPALETYRASMRAAERTYEQTKADAVNYFETTKGAAEAAFKIDRDKEKWQQAKEALKQQFEQAREDARNAFESARTAAKEQFISAVAGLGLSDEVVEKLLDWEFEFSFDYDVEDQDEDIDDEDESDDEDNDKDDDEDDDEQDENEGENDEGEDD